jgi:hypothetical protein
VDHLVVYVTNEYGPMVFWWPRRTYIGPVLSRWTKVEAPHVSVEVANGRAAYLVEDVDSEQSLLLCNLISYEPLNPAV